MHTSVLNFFIDNIDRSEFEGKRVLEIGSRFVNGSVRPIIEKFMAPKEYVGVDIEAGKNVDLILPVEEIVKRFGHDSFDVVISTEMLEHVLNWRVVIDNIKSVVKPGGLVYITTRSMGFSLHSFPYDYWRYELQDLERIFGDYHIISILKDQEFPGVFLKTKKPQSPKKTIDLNNIRLYAIITGERTDENLILNNSLSVRKCMQRFLTSKVKYFLPYILMYSLEKRFMK
jgi:SAM-dependent methyltransferase